MYELSDTEFNATLSLGDDYQKFFCLKNCLEHNVVFILKGKTENSEPVLILSDESQEQEHDDDMSAYKLFLPIWCHERYAQLYLEQANQTVKDDYEIAQIKLDVFKQAWVPMLKENGIALAILPLNDEKLFCVEHADVFDKPLQGVGEQSKE